MTVTLAPPGGVLKGYKPFLRDFGFGLVVYAPDDIDVRARAYLIGWREVVVFVEPYIPHTLVSFMPSLASAGERFRLSTAGLSLTLKVLAFVSPLYVGCNRGFAAFLGHQ